MNDASHRIDMKRNETYQRSLANSLIASLGMDDAIDACRRNCWDGVLEILLRMDRTRIC